MGDILKSDKINNKFAILILMFVFVNYASYGWVFTVMLLPFLVTSLLRSSIIDSNFLLILLFGITYCTIGDVENRGISFSLTLIVVCPLIYAIGRSIAHINTQISVEKILLLCIVGIAAISVISIAQEIMANGFVGYTRNIAILGSGDEMAATGTSARMALLTGASGMLFAVAKTKSETRIKIWLILLSVLALVCSFRLGTRTSIALFLVSIAVSYIYHFRKIKLASKVIFAIFIWGVIAVLIYLFATENEYVSFYLDRMDSDQYGLKTGGGRTELMAQTIELIPDYLMGGQPQDRFAHNLWLDVVKVSGIIPMGILLIITIKSLFILASTIRNKRLTMFLRAFILLVFMSLFVQMMAEPILEGAMVLFMFFCFIMGVMKEINIKSKLQI